MITKKRTILLLMICLLTVGFASVYAAGSNPFEALDAQFENLLSDFGDMWDRINGLESNIATLEAKIDALEGPPSIEPTYTIRIDTYDIDLSEHGTFEVWNYVHNPSLTIERGDEGPLHNVEVQHITVTLIDSVETTIYRFYPNGEFSWPPYDDRWPFPGHELRWDATVHPGETALVQWGGWMAKNLGTIQCTYELCVIYEGTTYNLVNTFEINVHE